MVMDQIFGQTKTENLVTEENGSFVVVEPRGGSLIITDIDITIRKEREERTGGTISLTEDFDLILQIGDDKNRFELADIDTNEVKVYNYKSKGLAKYWKGGRFEVLKNFAGKITLAVQYIRVGGVDYSIWQQRR